MLSIPFLSDLRGFLFDFGVPLHLFACLEEKEPLKREKTYSKNYEFDQVLCEDEELKATKQPFSVKRREDFSYAFISIP